MSTGVSHMPEQTCPCSESSQLMPGSCQCDSTRRWLQEYTVKPIWHAVVEVSIESIVSHEDNENIRIAVPRSIRGLLRKILHAGPSDLRDNSQTRLGIPLPLRRCADLETVCCYDPQGEKLPNNCEVRTPDTTPPTITFVEAVHLAN